MNLLEIVQTVCDELGQNAPNAVAGTNDKTARQLFALANRAGDELYQTYGWTALQKERIVNIAAPINTTGNLTANSDLITNIPSTAGIVADQWAVSADAVPIAARVAEVVDANTIRMDSPASQTLVGTAVVFARDTYAVPDDFGWWIARTMWDRTNRWELIGPIAPWIDEWQRSGVVTTGPRRRWRQIGLKPNVWRLWPPPTAPSDYPGTLVFEQQSKFWVLGVDGAPKARFTADSDEPIVDDQAIILSIKWRWWQAKGFDYLAMQAEYNDYVQRLCARDGGAADLTLGRQDWRPLLLGPNNVMDGNWPGPGNGI